MTVAEALSGCGIDPLEARMLLTAASGLARSALIAHPEAHLADVAVKAFRASVVRRRAGEPIAYLVGEREFYGILLRVTPDVLIPRPETELLVDFALEYLPSGGTLLDLGTGSGAIAVAVKHQRPGARVTAVEQSAAAIRIARINAARHGIDIEFVEGCWFEPLGQRRFDIVVSNPPYIAEGDRHLGQGDLRFEPRAALACGADGLDAIRIIVSAGQNYLNPGGWIAIEHGQGQDDAARSLLVRAGLESVSSRPDIAGIARISVGKYNPE